jgi:nicotinate-nucleotide--dimethylbenzimidazole phosphoribosyltransferase
MPESIRTLDDVRALAARLPSADAKAATAARLREPTLTKPQGALGRLEELSEWLAAWQGRHPPQVERVQALVFAANHGVARRGVSAFPVEVTRQMVLNFEAGGAAINQLTRVAGADLTVIDAGVDAPSEDFSVTPAMSEAECAAAIRLGFESLGAGYELLIVGEMGIGNTTVSAALCHAAFAGTAAEWVGAGTGVAGAAFEKKIAVVSDSVSRHRPAMKDGLDMLRHVGGKEIAAIAGAILAARLNRVPVVLDGFVTGGAAAALHALDPKTLDHCVAGHVSAEPGHRRLLERLGKKPLLDLGMRLGEGTGAALAVGLLKGAAACHSGMATFNQAGVSDRDAN